MSFFLLLSLLRVCWFSSRVWRRGGWLGCRLGDRFKEEIEELVGMCPINRQTLLFSATMNTTVEVGRSIKTQRKKELFFFMCVCLEIASVFRRPFPTPVLF